MEKRRSERKHVNLLKAELCSDGTSYPGVIEDISEHGLHMITASMKCITSFIPESTFDLNLQPPSGKETNLFCEVRWVHINKTPVHALTYRMGMEIINQSPEYEELLNTLE
jgi:hypothetical protein